MFGHPVKQSRFPHSETAGSKVYGTSPTSIAAVCVLPRSKSPRHPLLALNSKFLYTPFMYSPAGDERGLDIFIPYNAMEHYAGYSLHFLKSY